MTNEDLEQIRRLLEAHEAEKRGREMAERREQALQNAQMSREAFAVMSPLFRVIIAALLLGITLPALGFFPTQTQIAIGVVAITAFGTFLMLMPAHWAFWAGGTARPAQGEFQPPAPSADLQAKAAQTRADLDDLRRRMSAATR